MKPDTRHRIPLDRENWKWLSDRARTAFPPCSVAKMANAMVERMRIEEVMDAVKAIGPDRDGQTASPREIHRRKGKA